MFSNKVVKSTMIAAAVVLAGMAQTASAAPKASSTTTTATWQDCYHAFIQEFGGTARKSTWYYDGTCTFGQ